MFKFHIKEIPIIRFEVLFIINMLIKTPLSKFFVTAFYII